MILFVGELLADMIAEEPLDTAKHFEMKVGGSPGNIASYLSQLGVKVRILSRVGNDIIGKRIINKLRQKGVDTSYIQIDKEYGTTLVFVQKTKDTISYKLKVYGIFCSYDMKDIQPQKRHEVRAFGSITLQDILQSKKLRREVLPLLQLFEQNKPNLYEELRG